MGNRQLPISSRWHTDMYVLYIYIHIHIHMYAVYVHMDMWTYVYIYMYICIYILKCLHMYKYTSRPLYGGGSGVCVYFVYVYIVLCFVGLRWVALGPHFASWGDFAPPFGSLWGALGSQGGLLGVTLASLCLPWRSLEPFGAPWAPKGSLDWLWLKMDVQFRGNGSQVFNLRTKSNLAELSPRSGISTQSGARAAAPNPTSLAPGARMTWV